MIDTLFHWMPRHGIIPTQLTVMAESTVARRLHNRPTDAYERESFA
jgi:hypothetical protein